MNFEDTSTATATDGTSTETLDEPDGPDTQSLGSDGPLQRLFDGEVPGPEVPELKRQYELPQWAAITGRGFMRVATGSGVPPIFEIVMGGILGVRSVQSNGSAGESDGNLGSLPDEPHDPEDTNL